MGYLTGAVATGAAAFVASAAWATRSRSASVFGSSYWRGPSTGRAIALTFDDGPSESTPEILALLDRYGARATFFQCGANVERLPEIARKVSRAGHEIGNHTYSHPRLWLRSPAFIEDEIARAQHALGAIHGEAPRLFRAPYGVRWPGLGAAQRRHRLTGVMWTTIGRDWIAAPQVVADRLVRGASPGAIFCLHDGRELQVRPDISATVQALEIALPLLRDRGFTFTPAGAFHPPTLSH